MGWIHVAAIVSAAALVSAALLPARSVSRSLVDPPPLVVLVTIDALRADHLGAYGYSRPTSPNIDRLARESSTFDAAIANAPYTKASIASLMTGLYPTAHKTFTVSATLGDTLDGGVADALPATDILSPAATTLAEAMKARGYETVAFTTNPFLISDFGFAQGFDRFEFVWRDNFAPARDVLARTLHQVAEASRPLFVWVHLMEPHSPYNPGQAFARMFPPLLRPYPIPADVTVPPYLAEHAPRDVRVLESLYDAEIRSVDDALGTFLEALRRRPGWRRTVVVLAADHGEQFFEHGGFEHNTNLHDELIRVPLIIRAPGMAANRIGTQVQLVDVLPTLVALTGASLDDDVNGRDLSPLLRGEWLASEPAFSERVGEQYAVRTREWKLIAGPGSARELFALARDPREQYSVRHPRKQAELETMLAQLLAASHRAGRHVGVATTTVDAIVRERLQSLGYIQR